MDQYSPLYVILEWKSNSTLITSNGSGVVHYCADVTVMDQYFFNASAYKAYK